MSEWDGNDLDEIARKVRRRAAGEWDALRESWADEVTIWHCYDNEESTITGLSRSAGASAELIAFTEALDDFQRHSTVHVSAATDTIVETSVWSGRNRAGVELTNATCIVYSVSAGRIIRMDIYDDGNRSRRFAEVLVHHLIAGGSR